MYKKEKIVTKTGCLNFFDECIDFFYFCKSKSDMENMNCKENKDCAFENYVTPGMSVIDIQSEGVLCDSNESLDESLGDW